MGPILEETIFKKEPKINLPSSINTLSDKGLVADNLDLRTWLLNRAAIRRISQFKDPDRNFPARLPGISNKRLPPSTYQSGLWKETLQSKPSPGNGQIDGPVKERTVLYRPSLPVLPDWLKEEKLRLNIEIKFWVSPDGLVEHAEPLISCGYPEIDLLMVRYLDKWRFQPLAGDLDGEQGQWGVARLFLYDKD